MPNILHITPHFGGGVGSVLRGLIDELGSIDGFEQEIVTFDFINEQSSEWAKKRGHRVKSEISPLSPELHAIVCAADIVHLHFWNHPLTYLFLQSFSGNKARVVMWAHCNGAHAPYLFPDAVLTFPQLFVTTSEYSAKTKNIASQPAEWRSAHLRNITSRCDTADFLKITPEKHSGVVVGYVGTVDYCKMHRKSLDMLGAVSTPDVRFVVCGGDSHEVIQAETCAKGWGNRFDFRGKVSDVPAVLAELDIFAYPLTKKHYGTGEQVLVEAMAAGIPQVVLNNGPESYIVRNGVTGIVADGPEEFTRAIERLAADPKLRREMGENSRRHAAGQCSINKMVDEWNVIYGELLEYPKKECDFECSPYGAEMQDDPAVLLFLCSLVDREVQDIFKEAFSFYTRILPEICLQKLSSLQDIYFAQGKGSIHQYAQFLDSKKLRYLSKIMLELVDSNP
ncbi:glycosyltransferase family 4 protein [Maridesulfovibrio sp.]|uniref:glycosyltransferase family 4 protein n=1 Tax=Maridesulfovibrio sp. TaxID=2795000 RepID=UPI0029F4736E|nr:glycosyltransferase family 4 protein [Maridesulfovibrio sp.]